MAVDRDYPDRLPAVFDYLLAIFNKGVTMCEWWILLGLALVIHWHGHRLGQKSLRPYIKSLHDFTKKE